VRAVDVTGTAASAPAVVVFRILPPIWQRWWFLLLAATVTGIIGHSLYRYRLAKQLQLEQVRLHIATDLHDDIGASLSQIALLSDLAGQQAGTESRLSVSLEQIGAASRQLVDSMSEIVWSINPRRDTLGDLSVRMRAFASDVFPARNIAFRFAAPVSEADLKLALDARRQIFLIFKESVNNVVRHAECSEAEIDFASEPGKLVMRVHDNGKGFDGRQTSAGHGLSSMRDRARRLGGDLQVTSGEGGTAVVLTVPVGRGRTWWRKRFLRE
jgi:signal transduction histidine kinase